MSVDLTTSRIRDGTVDGLFAGGQSLATGGRQRRGQSQMNRFVQLLVTAATALAVLFIMPGAALASVPLTCTFSTSAISSAPLQETVTLDCSGSNPAWDHVDDASLVGPATVNFYSGNDLNWTKTVTVPTAGKYKLRITITTQSMAGPVTGTSTCCGTTVYAANPTPAPTPVVTPPPATPRPVVTPPPATPRPVVTPPPATPRPVVTLPPVVPTAEPVPTAVPTASNSPLPSPSEVPTASVLPTESPRPSASPPGNTTPELTASPTVTSAPILATTSPHRGSGSTPALAWGGLIALGSAIVFLILLVLRRKRRSSHQAAFGPRSAALRS